MVTVHGISFIGSHNYFDPTVLFTTIGSGIAGNGRQVSHAFGRDAIGRDPISLHKQGPDRARAFLGQGNVAIKRPNRIGVPHQSYRALWVG